jgi:hypothetical protein
VTLNKATLASAVCAVAYDAIHENAQYIPSDAFAVGGYVNGANKSFIWTASDWAMFPNSFHIYINVTGDPTHGNCLDIESGDATIADIVPWMNSRGPALVGPMLLYCNGSNLSAVLNERTKSTYAGKTYMWESTLDGTIEYSRAMTQAFQSKVNGVAVMDVSLILDVNLRQAMVNA